MGYSPHPINHLSSVIVYSVMRKIVGYIVEVGYTTDILVRLVNHRIKEGYEPLGGVSSDRDYKRQAMVKYEKAPKKI